MDTQEGIKRAAERARGAAVRFVEAVAVVETFRGEVVWEGGVSEFDPSKGKVYAWAVEGDKEPQFIAVLADPPDSLAARRRAGVDCRRRTAEEVAQ